VIVTDAVSAYLDSLRGEPDSVLAEMEAPAGRDGIPIVVPSTGQLLAVLVLASGARRIVEVGTAIGVSTLYMARALPANGRIATFEIDEARHVAAREYLSRAGVLDRVDLHLQDAREGLASVSGEFDLAFVDGVKSQYGDYLDALLPLIRRGGIIAVDNVLMGGTVAENHSDGHWSAEQIATARGLNERLLTDPELHGTVTPVGDGVLIAVRR
jgi:caffeoyl-CoA O-methyltransferase